MDEYLKPDSEFKEIEKKTEELEISMDHEPKRVKKKSFSRESIIGLGEDSFRKNYYPELQEKIIALEETNLRNKALLEAIPDVLIVSDLEGNLSPFGSRLKVFSPLMNKVLSDEKATSFIQKCVRNVIDSSGVIQCEFIMEFENEKRYYEIRTHRTDMNEILVIIRDMTRRALLENELRHIAEIDVLTQVYNRYSFEKELLRFSGKEVKSIGFLIVDIDGLKLINDALGHIAGDNMIKVSAKIIKDVVKSSGFIARIGGDEFGIVIEDATVQNLESIVMELSNAVVKFNEEGQTLDLSMSYGYSFHKSGVIDTSLLYQEADNNMYQSKLLKTSSNKSHIVKSLMKALEVRDYITEGHADRMGELALKMGRVIGLTSVQLNRIELLAKFHDIGKVGISDAILNKPGKLTPSEYTIMKTHSVLGERIANESGELREISKLILKHHERFDGKGYPLGLKGMEIPIECRIISIVDTYDAMINDRPYRKALSNKVAIEELLLCSGSQFDPELIRVFMNLI